MKYDVKLKIIKTKNCRLLKLQQISYDSLPSGPFLEELVHNKLRTHTHSLKIMLILYEKAYFKKYLLVSVCV